MLQTGLSELAIALQILLCKHPFNKMALTAKRQAPADRRSSFAIQDESRTSQGIGRKMRTLQLLQLQDASVTGYRLLSMSMSWQSLNLAEALCYIWDFCVDAFWSAG